MLTELCLLVAAHALADFPLQGEFMAKAKDPERDPLRGSWRLVMGMHASIHALGVGLVLGSLPLALAEWGAHFGIDYNKCRGRLTFNEDQGLHLFCKFSWVVLALAGAR